jgi:hypothetical protein
MSFEIRPATRASVKPLIGFYGASGGGKTLSALLTMRGLVGPKGRIVGLDTENRRMSIHADSVPGFFSVCDIDPPFSAARYWEAIETVATQADGIVIDSFSHEWAGEGGVLDQQEAELTRMAGDNWSKREACKMASWIRPKMEHKRLVERMLRLPVPVIVCMRGEQKTHIEKGDQGGKTQVHTDKFCSPIGDPRFIFEMLIHAECIAKPDSEGRMIGGYLRVTKITHQDVIAMLPGAGEQIGVKHGEALARWCQGGATAPATAPAAVPADPVKELKTKIWRLTSEIHNKKRENLDKLVAWLRSKNILGQEESWETLTVEQLTFILDKTEIELCNGVTP